MKRLLIVIPFLIAACSTPESQQLLTACEAHDTANRALVPLTSQGKLSQRQVDAVDDSVELADSICDGSATNFRAALSTLEGELLRMFIIQKSGSEE